MREIQESMFQVGKNTSFLIRMILRITICSWEMCSVYLSLFACLLVCFLIHTPTFAVQNQEKWEVEIIESTRAKGAQAYSGLL